ncbi:MAG: GNAT family N-acetyltransferase [Tannerellaceae bacterium]|jgi:predicted acetyltransferase|nr:GNAT family N-acetyltransferase [Tannerellaceae bacterium]
MPEKDAVEKGKRSQIRRLWKTVFDDTDEFVQFYFRQVYEDDNALVIEKGGQVVSALQMLPYTMTFCGEEIPVAYISGACTLPSEQGKGLMKQLLQKAVSEMERKKTALSALIPAGKGLFEYYRAHGYTEVFEYSTETYTRNEPIASDDIFVHQNNKPDEITYAYLERQLRKRPMAIQHSYDDFILILKDLEIDNGQLFVASDSGGQPAGMAFVSTQEIKTNAEESSILIKEILYDTEAVKEHLLHEITIRHNLVRAIYRTPVRQHLPTFPYGMARVIDAERLIGLWLAAHPESELSVNDMRSMNIHTLTAHLTGYSDRAAYMSLMLD